MFSEPTEYGRTGNVESYGKYMTECIAKVEGGSSLIRDHNEPDSTSWGDEGHIIAISLLYDIRIYIYFVSTLIILCGKYLITAVL